jgi:hypothetical protein
MSAPTPASGLVPVPAVIAADVRAWASALRTAAGPAYLALYVHGSALGPQFDPQSSDVNLLLLVSELPFERLTALSAAVRNTATAVKRRVSPLVLTENQVRTSLDVFPAEFLDLASRRALVDGTDVLAGLDIGRDNLRHQCEYELRSKLVGLRQAYLLAGAAAGLPQRVLAQAAGGLSAVLRHLLGLRNEPVPDGAEALVEAIARTFHVDATGLAAPFAARRATLSEDEARALFAQHLAALEKLTSAIDAFPTA